MKACRPLRLTPPKQMSRMLGLTCALAVSQGALAGCGRPESGGVLGTRESARLRECTGLPPLAQKSHYRVGFVPIYEPTNPWGVTNTNAMIRETARRGYELIYSPFTNDATEQVTQMRALVAARVDAIILRPIDARALAPSVIMARRACIPVFTENRFIDRRAAVPGVDYVTGIGADPVLQGRMVADWLVRDLDGPATIIEIEGSRGSSSAIGRKQGFDAQIADHPGMKIVASESADFDRAKGYDVAKRLLMAHPGANVIFAHADTMALGALAAVRELKRVPGKDIFIVSIDGLKEAVQGVMDGTIAAVVFNDPRLAAISLDTMEQYAGFHTVAQRIVVQGYLIDRSNAAQMLHETF
jgi:ABC-type sugar transport system substrate-binding protein